MRRKPNVVEGPRAPRGHHRHSKEFPSRLPLRPSVVTDLLSGLSSSWGPLRFKVLLRVTSCPSWFKKDSPRNHRAPKNPQTAVTAKISQPPNTHPPCPSVPSVVKAFPFVLIAPNDFLPITAPRLSRSENTSPPCPSVPSVVKAFPFVLIAPNDFLPITAPRLSRSEKTSLPFPSVPSVVKAFAFVLSHRMTFLPITAPRLSRSEKTSPPFPSVPSVVKAFAFVLIAPNDLLPITAPRLSRSENTSPPCPSVPSVVKAFLIALCEPSRPLRFKIFVCLASYPKWLNVSFCRTYQYRQKVSPPLRVSVVNSVSSP